MVTKEFFNQIVVQKIFCLLNIINRKFNNYSCHRPKTTTYLNLFLNITSRSKLWTNLSVNPFLARWSVFHPAVEVDRQHKLWTGLFPRAAKPKPIVRLLNLQHHVSLFRIDIKSKSLLTLVSTIVKLKYI